MSAISPPSAIGPAISSDAATGAAAELAATLAVAVPAASAAIPGVIVVFGAAVRADGSPSPALARRIGYALAAAEAHPDAILFCSGAVGRHGPSEAAVMAALLAPQLGADRLHLDERSVDTLQSVRAAARFMRTRGISRCWSCTDGYHQPRVIMLFALYGIRARAIRFTIRGTRRNVARMHAREALALPYDLIAGANAALRDRLGRRPGE